MRFGITTRPAVDSDEPAALRLFESSFGHAMAPQTWRWKYAASAGLSRVAVGDDGALVAHIGVVPVPLNVIGARESAGMVTDFMISAEHRGLGLNDQLFDEVHAAMLARRIPVSLSFPSDLAVAPLHRKATRVAMMEKYRLPMNGEAHRRLRARVDGRPADERMAVTFEPQYELDARYDSVWSSVRKLESLSLWKDRRYLGWRSASGTPLRFMALLFGEELGALAVCTSRRDTWVILDLVARGKSIELGRELLRLIANHAAEHGVVELRFTGCDAWYYREAFSEFDRRPTFSNHVFARATDPTRAFLYENPINWSFTLGDAEAL